LRQLVSKLKLDFKLKMTEASRKRTLKDFHNADGNQKPVDLAKKRTQGTKVSVKDAKDKVGKKPKV
jgi:hypothetical protein